MNMMEFLQIAQHSARCLGTAVDRCDIEYYSMDNYTAARVWLNDGRVFDISDSPKHIREYNGGEGDYLVTFRDSESYIPMDSYDEEEWIEFTHKRYMNYLEKEDYEKFMNIEEDQGV